MEFGTHVSSYDLDWREELLWAVALGFVFTVLRWIGNFLALGHVFIGQKKSLLRKSERLFEEFWLVIFSSALLVGSWMVFIDNDVGASVMRTLPLIHGWPDIVAQLNVLYFLRIETGWYLHQVTRGWSASGVPLDNVMFYHHVVTLLIFRFCFWKNLLLMGVLTVAIFNISNPFLHLSKVAHIMNWIQLRVVLFGLFALAFFVSRIVIFPLTIMKIGYVDAYQEDYVRFGQDLILLGNVLMLGLYGFQIYWMVKIILVLLRGRTGTTPKKSETKETPFSDTKPFINGKAKQP